MPTYGVARFDPYGPPSSSIVRASNRIDQLQGAITEIRELAEEWLTPDFNPKVDTAMVILDVLAKHNV
jgi:hypothetical protein